MLIDTQILQPNPYDRIVNYGFAGVIAECPETGARLYVGNGRRKAGRPRRYFIKVRQGDGYDQIGTVTAFYDDDAIAKANKRLERQ